MAKLKAENATTYLGLISRTGEEQNIEKLVNDAEKAKNQLEADITSNKCVQIDAKTALDEAMCAKPFSGVAVVEAQERLDYYTKVVDNLTKLRSLFPNI